MKILVTGFGGQLGYDVIKVLKSRNIECIGTDMKDFSLTDREATIGYIKDYAPDMVIHCAAYTAVDNAEDNRELCFAVNEKGTEYVAEACKEIGAKMIYISTDYVFPGNGENFYAPLDEKSPCNVYGESKLAGELAVQHLVDKYYIVRISWVFGINGKNFIKTMLKLGETHKELTVVDDQIGSPTYTADLAVLLADMAESDKYGIYHATNEGICSWAEFAAEIFRQADMDVKVTPVPSTAYPTKAVRPKNSRMSKEALTEAGFNRLPSWQDALARYLEELKTIEQ